MADDKETKIGEVTRNVSPPERFNFEARDWPVWKQRFQRYRRLTDLDKKNGEKQVDILIYSMGEKADEIFSSFKLSDDDAKDYEKVIKEFDAYFVGKRNIIYDRARFQLRCQEDGEAFESFVTALHTLADYCNYGDLKEELIRDRIVVGVRDRKLSDKLMLIETLDLVKAKEICKQWEAVRRQQGYLSGKGDAPSGSVDRVKSSKPKECKYCNRRHEWVKEKCPAYGKTCAKCGLKNHFAASAACMQGNSAAGPGKNRGSINAVEMSNVDSDDFIF